MENVPKQTVVPESPMIEKGHFEYKYLYNKIQRKLLGKSVEKVIDMVDELATKEQVLKPNVVFLDRSARPISTYLIHLWKKKFLDKPLPSISFLNIGSELKGMTKEGQNVTDNPDVLAEIERIRSAYSYLRDAKKGSTVFIVDDVENSGFARVTSVEILSTTFPELKFQYTPLVKVREENQRDPEIRENAEPRLFDRIVYGMDGKASFITQAPWSRKVSIGFGVEDKDVFDTLHGVADNRSKFSLTSIPFTELETFKEGSDENNKIKSIMKSEKPWEVISKISSETKRDVNGSKGEVLDTLRNSDDKNDRQERLNYLYDGSSEIRRLRDELANAADEYWKTKTTHQS